jgi:phosphoribosyl-ATP pyrophosphohydrolase/phosphoribosyl-AMP cyclohydrolase
MKLDFSKTAGLIPAIIQDARTKNVLMLGYMNEAALQKTLETGIVTFFSRSKQRLWTKGETSGNTLKLVDCQQDCDADTLLIQAIPKGPTCHQGTDSCFGFKNENQFSLSFLESIIVDRKNNASENSYTKQLFDKGINKVAQKVGEEAVELVIEAKDDNKELFLGEAADLMYHYLVLLAAKEISLQAVLDTLEARHQKT